MKRGCGARWLLLVPLVCCALLTGCARKDEPPRVGAGGDSRNGAGVADPAEEKKHVDAFGIVKARKIRNINLDFPATLQRKLVTDGQRVGLGEVLFRFSSDEYDSEVRSKTFDLTMARLELKKTTQEIQRLREDLETAHTEEERTRRDLDLKEKALSLGAASRSDVDDIGSLLRARQLRILELERSLESQSGGEVNGLEAQRMKIANLEEELEHLRNQRRQSFISGNTVVSDIAKGVVYEIGYAEGDFITAARKLCSLLDLESVFVEAYVPEEFIKDVRIGSRAEVVPVADNTKKYKGTVTRIANLAVKANGETVITIEIGLETTDAILLPAFNVDVSVY